MPETALRSVRGGKLLIVSVALVGGLLILARLAGDLYVESLWYREAGYFPVFFRRLAWFWGTRLVAGAFVAVALVASLRLVARTLGGIQIKRRFGNLEISEQLPKSYVWWGIVGTSVLLGAWFGGSVPENMSWAILAALQNVQWGVSDPVLGRDASFYVFVLPLLRSGLTFLMVVTFLVFTVTTGGYAATGAVRWGRRGIVMGEQARVHLGALVAFFVLLLAVRFWLARSILLLSGNSGVQGIFGYADAEARLPALRAMTLVTAAAAGGLMWGVWKNRLVPVIAGLGAVVIGSLVGVNFYPSLVQRLRVEPNELARETPYIEHNIRFTRMGFGLSQMERVRFEYEARDTTDWGAAFEQFEGLPVWTPATLLTTFRELEARFPYYQFENVDFDRYPSAEGGEPVPVAVSVREIDPGGIQDPNWQNLTLRERYIVGMGAVASAANRSTEQGRPLMYLTAIPPEFVGGPAAPQALRLTRPAVFFGSREQRYAVVNAAVNAGPGDGGLIQGVPGIDFPEGILMDAVARKLALAWYFRDASLLLASEVTDSSRFVFRRRVVERAEAIAPFFRYTESPYPVVHEGRIVWVLEGFTATRAFPLASPQEMDRQRASWVRNSVKVTVDAVTGETRFYALAEPDPLREAYARAFPGLLRPIDEMPAELRRHLRYPKALLNVQSRVLLQYHQETAPRFHGQEDVWALPYELFRSTNPIPYQPEYGFYRLPGGEKPTFNLTTAFVPEARPNLTGVLVGRLEEDGTPRLVLYDVPVEDQAPGPSQVEALVEQDPVISQQFSLWRTGGSEVWTGHLHLVPVGNQLLYMEPVFLAAETEAIPELRRYVVSDGRRVSMEPTLEGAVAVLAGDEQLVRRAAPPESVLPTPQGDVRWPREALELLQEAEAHLRGGDWQGFGQALDRLRTMLERIASGGSP